MAVGLPFGESRNLKGILKGIMRNELKPVETPTALRGKQLDALQHRCEELEIFRAATIHGKPSTPVPIGKTDEETTSAPPREEALGQRVLVQAVTAVGAAPTQGVSVQQIPGTTTGHHRAGREYGLWTVKELQQELRNSHIKTSGLKNELVEQLRQADENAGVSDELSPTRAQITWMKTIAARRNIPIDARALAERSAASIWISKH